MPEVTNRDHTMDAGEVVIDNIEASYAIHRIFQPEMMSSSIDLFDRYSSRTSIFSLEKDIPDGFHLKIPFRIELKKGDRLIILGEPNAGKT